MKRINKKGFTLIEMLGAVAILGIIATIGIVSVSKVIQSAHKKFDNTQYDSFMQAAETYFSDNKSNLPLTPMEWKEISLQELINKKYIEKLLDSNKEEFDFARSKVRVTRLTSGKYQYEAILYRKDGTTIGEISNKVVNQNSGITFKLLNKNNYYSENKTYYARDYPVVEITISDTDQLSGYQYIIYRNGKQFKKSENIELSGGESKTDKVTLGKEFSYGKYSIKVVVYDKSGNKTTSSTDDSGDPNKDFSIYIDRTKPNCSISVAGTVGDNGWYKANHIQLTLKESDKESGIIKHGLQHTTNNFNNSNLSKPTSTLSLPQWDTEGITYYAHVEDKAGNVCEAETTVKVDTQKPSCNILDKESKDTINPSIWYNMETASIIDRINLTDVNKDNGPSGINRYILQMDKPDLASNYKSYLNNNSSLGTSEGEHTYYGYIRDKAGNAESCEKFIKKDTVPPNCNTAGSGVFSYGPTPSQGWTQSVAYTIAIGNQDTIKQVDLALTRSGSSKCSDFPETTFSNLDQGSIVYGSVGTCYKFDGTVTAEYTYHDQADNQTTCSDTSKNLKHQPIKGCTDSSAKNYNEEAEEDDGSCLWQCETPGASNYRIPTKPKSAARCYWMCDDSSATNYHSEISYYGPVSCIYDNTDETPTPKCSDQDAENYNEEGACWYKCTDPDAENYGRNEKCEYKEAEPLSCDDIKIEYDAPGKKVTFNDNEWTNKTVNVKVKIKKPDKIDHWDWWTNETDRTPSDGPGSFEGCLKDKDSCEYINNSSNTGNDTKEFKGEGVRRGKIVLYGKKNQKSVNCSTDIYRIDKTPPEITSVCRFNNEETGFSCTGEDGAKHLYNGVFIRVEDKYVGIGSSKYELRGNPSSRSGDNTVKADRYCLSAGGEQVDSSHKLTYTVCDMLDNCTDPKEQKKQMKNEGDFGGGTISCDDLKEMHKCQKVNNNDNVKYKCKDNDDTNCYNSHSEKVRCP